MATQSLEEEEGRRQSSVKRKGATKWEDEREVMSEEERKHKHLTEQEAPRGEAAGCF